jgi:hypothetical protein
MWHRGISQLNVPQTWIASLTKGQNCNCNRNHPMRVEIQGKFVSRSANIEDLRGTRKSIR